MNGFKIMYIDMYSICYPDLIISSCESKCVIPDGQCLFQMSGIFNNNFFDTVIIILVYSANL